MFFMGLDFADEFVGLIDLGDTLSFKVGPHDFVKSGSEKQINQGRNTPNNQIDVDVAFNVGK